MNISTLKKFLLSLHSNRTLTIIKYPIEVQYLIDNTTFLPTNTKLSQRSWHIINDTYHVMLCKECTNKVSWWPRYKKYNTFCSNACVGKSKEVKRKRLETTMENYGVSVPAKNNTIKKRMENTLMKNYGVQHPLQNKKIKQKAINTWKNKYNCDHPSFIHISPEILSLLHNKNWLIEQHHTKTKTLTQICKQYLNDLDISALSRYMTTHNIKIKSYSRSQGEIEVGNFISSLNIGEIIFNDRTLILPLELDIYIPEHKLAIEYCGLYWHSEQAGKNKQYHKNKMSLCNAANVRLITLYENEWLQNQNLVKQKIKHILKINKSNTIYARKCKIQYIDTKNKRDFLQNNHIQQDCNTSINIGLTYKNNIVAIMCFIQYKNSVYYLSRYATSHNIPGGFSKLLTYFQTNYNWQQLISFADLRWSTGVLYKQTGWLLDSILPPDYSYSPDGINRYHKFNYRHSKLPSKLNKYNMHISEKKNCDNNNILRIWDCGKLKFTLINKQK